MLKSVPTVTMARPMVTKPAYMIGLRPSLSTNAMAMKVKHVGYSDDHRSPHLLIRGFEPRNAKNRRREIHHDVDAGKLLDDLQSNPKPNGAAEVGIGLEHLKSILFDFQVVLDPFHLRRDLGFIKMHSLEHGYAAIFETFQEKPSRAFGQEEDADEHDRSWNSNHTEHDAPVAAGHPAKRRVGREPRVAQKRKHDSDGDH